MALILSFFITFFLSLSSYARSEGGIDVGNGGDTIWCTPSSESPFAGSYTLDYLLEYRNAGNYGEIAEVTDWPTSRDRIGTILKTKYPELYLHYKNFVDHILNTSDLSAYRVWEAHTLGLEDLKDENITRNLPRNCLNLNSSSPYPQLTQTVIRKLGQPQIVYHFDPAILLRQRDENPLQYSFFLVHEWLWDLTDNVDSVRKLNWLLHSKNISEWSETEFQRLFLSLGFFKRELHPCLRSELVTQALKKHFETNKCEDMSFESLKNIKSLDFDGLSSAYPMRVGDLYALNSLESLSFRNVIALDEKLFPEFFSTLYSLKNLNLSHTGLTRFGTSLSRGLSRLRTLDLSSNPLQSVEPSFQELKRLEVLKLSLNTKVFSQNEEILNLPPALKTLVIHYHQDLAKRVEVLDLGIKASKPRLNLEWIKN